MTKFYLMILILSTLSSCAPDRYVVQVVKGDPGRDGTSCTVASIVEGEQTLGALVSCTDGSSALIVNGASGAQGVAGATGEDGQNGEDGAAGVAGANGESCSATRNSGEEFVTISCPGSSPVVVYDGADGTDGTNGFNGTNGTNSTGCTLTAAGQDKYNLTCGTTTILINNVKNNGNGNN